MQRNSDILGVILVCVQIPFVVLCVLQILEIPSRAEWLVAPGILGGFALAAALLLVVIILQRKGVLLMRPGLRWFTMCFTAGVWLLVGYTFKMPALMLLPLICVPALLRGWSKPA